MFQQYTNFVKGGINWNDNNLWLCLFFTAWTPWAYNVVCQYEYRHHSLTHLFGSAQLACFLLSLVQIACSQSRNYFFMQALERQTTWSSSYSNDVYVVRLGQLCTVLGLMFVFTSFLKLGWFGTWHGDHFGILLPAKVTSFPFNVLDHPMYRGAVLAFLGTAIERRSVVGILLSGYVHLVYVIAERWEGPFTDMIYKSAVSKSK